MDRLEPVLIEQDGFITSAQARALGIPGARIDRLLAANLLRRVRRGVYVMVKLAPILDLDERTYAAWLAFDAQRMPWGRDTPRVVISHATAAATQQLGTYVDDEVVHLTTADRARRTIAVDVKLHRSDLNESDWHWLQGRQIMATTPARTIVDMALQSVGRSYVLQALADAHHRDPGVGAALGACIDRQPAAWQRDLHYLIEWLEERE